MNKIFCKSQLHIYPIGHWNIQCSFCYDLSVKFHFDRCNGGGDFNMGIGMLSHGGWASHIRSTPGHHFNPLGMGSCMEIGSGTCSSCTGGFWPEEETLSRSKA